MGAYYFILIGGMLLFNGGALLVLRWALRTGQFRHPEKTALQIFDEAEPVGRMTDQFPGGNLPKGGAP